MIILEHHNGIVKDNLGNKKSLVAVLFELVSRQPEEEFVVHAAGIDHTAFLESIKDRRGRNVMISTTADLNSDFGYVEDTPFINVNHKVIYPTWKKSTVCFYMHAALINRVADQFPATDNLLYWLNSVAKVVRPQGVLCYQVPTHISDNKLSTTNVYKFVRQHYKRRWSLILLLCHIVYERRFPLFAFAKAQFYKSRIVHLKIEDLQEKKVVDTSVLLDYDVIIPTIGRAKYLKQVLKDLSVQSTLPRSVVIIEQSPIADSSTDLKFLTNESWPFQIVHEFTNKTGACRARNEAISRAIAQWVLLFDDDLSTPNDFIERAQRFIVQTKAKAVTFACLQAHENERQQTYKQWESFGSGCSIVCRDLFSKCSFDLALEHGYGEDIDYGMQIRNAGDDILYAPQIQIIHLKAPVGGFRIPHVFPWQLNGDQPKPSPQIMYFRKKNYSIEQLKGYKLVQFFKTYGLLGSRWPWTHYQSYKKAWAMSMKWAETLKGKSYF